MTTTKNAVRDFWDAASCGEALLLPATDRAGYGAQSRERYQLEPYIPGFANFDETGGIKVLEIGVGLGADHQRFAAAGAQLYGIDLTPRAVEHTRLRLSLFGLQSNLQVADAEDLPFADDTFDMVYSWGVIHHSPDTPLAAKEILRVLKPGGHFAVMIYHRRSLVGLMLWTRYALMRGRPFVSLDVIYSRYLESPGTKAYSVERAKALFDGAGQVKVWPQLSQGDLLSGGAGQRHSGLVLNLARRLWPRRLLAKFLPHWGLFLLIKGTK